MEKTEGWEVEVCGGYGESGGWGRQIGNEAEAKAKREDKGRAKS